MKLLNVAYFAIFTLFIMWAGISYIDIIADNCSLNPVHYPWNLWVLIFGS